MSFCPQGVSLPAAKERGQLVFLEGLKSCFEVLFKEEPPTGQPNPLQFIRSEPLGKVQAAVCGLSTRPRDQCSWCHVAAVATELPSDPSFQVLHVTAITLQVFYW